MMMQRRREGEKGGKPAPYTQPTHACQASIRVAKHSAYYLGVERLIGSTQAFARARQRARSIEKKTALLLALRLPSTHPPPKNVP
jgi:hypothetical protein